MRKDWHGLIKVLEIKHIRNGKVLWEAKDLYNMIHLEGDRFFLEALFVNDGTVLPTAYYLGLDARPAIAVGDTMADLVDEPDTNGYVRQQLSSETGWRVQSITDSEDNVIWRAIGNIITFSASGGDWGPVTNLFLTDKSDNTGTLLATVPLSQETSVSSGDSVSMRISLSLRDCPSS